MTPRYFQWDHKWVPREKYFHEYDSWGSSTLFFETSPEGQVLRELMIFEDGRVLKYDTEHSRDIYGQMSDGLHEINTFDHLEIPPHVFDIAWRNSTALNK